MKLIISSIKDSKTMKKSIAVMSSVYIAIGLVLLIWPNITSKIISYIFAGMILVYGLVKVYGYVKTSYEYRDLFVKFDFVAGVISIGLALFLFIKTEIVLSILPFLVGIYLVINSIFGIQASIHLKKIDNKTWLSSLILSLVLTVLGIVLVLNPFQAHILLIRFIGLSLIINAISDIWVGIQSIKMLK